ncbi:putative ATPase/DNA-binding SARP family transcriptional activator [Phytomonospora endophytica]|uniref:Putative ATPase/DNA-binding SARP family transcriptional activator n=1 Tax=Phytomonospora endophytica TaxID=714109 RepID=A0A841FIA6_9ACTN|nr:putative ATPase/DNA-binding SARP family transcriptional activator [Phytomonospora endophytica]GIG64916.1 SARP family transcriptional regulator [Phytomonospora endophytica]
MRIGVLGPLEVFADDGAPLAVTGARPRAFVTLLAAAYPKAVDAARLTALLWPGGPPANPANALQALVSRLRKVMGSERIRHTDGRYLLTGVEVDATRFAALLTDAARAPADERVGILRAALGLWRGLPLADAPVLGAEAARLTELRRDAVAAHGHACLDTGRAAEALALLTPATAADPRHEVLQALRIRALHATGRQAEALAAYEEVRAAINADFGADPGPELAAAYLAVLREPSPTTDPRGNLAHPITSFVGRDTEVAELRELLLDRRLVTLLGPGGAGKTRLAVETGRQTAADRPDGVWIAELAPLSDPAELPRTVARAIGVRDPLGVPLPSHDPPERLDRIVAAIGERRMLLILDNGEHLLDAVAALTGRLLSDCPELTILLTSREPLGIPGEVPRPVSPLPLPPTTAPAAEILRNPAIRLLRDRAATSAPSVILGDAQAPVLAQIVRRLDGMPLAIELAAARLRTLAPADLAARLDDRFGLLVGGSRAALPRHQTLRAVVEWSWDLLGVAERELARRFAVFAGPPDLAAVEATCAGASPATLGSLVDRSFVEFTGDGRYRMLETIRAYAAERLAEAGESASTADAHAAHFLAVAVAGQHGLHQPEQLEWLRRFTVHNDNLLAALRRLIDRGDTGDALRMCSALCERWWILNDQGEAALWARRVLAMVGDDGPPRGTAGAYAMCHFSAGFDAWAPTMFGDPAVMDAMTTDFLRLADAAEAEGTASVTVLAFGATLCMLAGRHDDGRARLSRYLTADDPWLVATAHMSLAYFALNTGDNATAVAEFETTVAAFGALGDRFNLANVSLGLADLCLRTGDHERAAALLSSVDVIADELADYVEAVDIHLWLTRIRLAGGDLAGAEVSARKARTMLGSAAATTRTHARLIFSTLLRAQGHLDEAVEVAGELVGELLAAGAVQPLVCWAYAQLGRARVARGETEEGLRDHARALRLLHVNPTTRLQAVPLIIDGVGLAALAGGDARRAATLFGMAAAFDNHTHHDADVAAVLPSVRAILGAEGFAEACAEGRDATPPGALSLGAEAIASLLGLDLSLVGADRKGREDGDEEQRPQPGPGQFGAEAVGVVPAEEQAADAGDQV